MQYASNFQVHQPTRYDCHSFQKPIYSITLTGFVRRSTVCESVSHCHSCQLLPFRPFQISVSCLKDACLKLSCQITQVSCNSHQWIQACHTSLSDTVSIPHDNAHPS